MRKLNIKFIGVVTGLLSFVMFGLIISMNGVDKQTEETTAFYTAVVTAVEMTDTGKNLSASIYTEEYSSCLYISTNICKYLPLGDMQNLRKGQNISFGIETTKKHLINQADFIDITALKIETTDIFTLKDYNEWMHREATPTRIVTAIAAVLLFSASVACFVKAKRK